MVASVVKRPTMIRTTLLCGRVLSERALWRLRPPWLARPEIPIVILGEGTWGCTKYKRVSKREEDWKGGVPKRSLPKRSLPRSTLQNKKCGAPILREICPKLLPTLLGVHSYLFKPALPQGQSWAQTFAKYAKIKGVIFSILIADSHPTTCSNPLTPLLPKRCSQAHQPSPSSPPPSTLMDANRR